MEELEYKGLKEKLYVHTNQKSGLKTYMWVNNKAHSNYFSLSVPYGSLYTDFKIKNKKYHVPNGLAHFLEHVKFNETEDFTAHDFFYKTGADANAFTTFKYTSYTLFLNHNFSENLTHLLDYVFNPFFSKKLIQKEKGIIMEEANMTKDEVYNEITYKHLRNILVNSNYRNSITGEAEDIKKITAEDLEDVYYSFYSPQNMFLCLTGNFNPYEAAKIIDEAMDQKTFKPFIKPQIMMPKEPKEVAKEYEEVNLNVGEERVRYALKIARNRFKNIDDWELLTILKIMFNLNFGITSDFRESLINEGLIQEIYSVVQLLDDYIIVNIVAASNYPEELIKRIEDKLNNININEKDIKRKLKANIATLILDFDDIESVNNRLSSDLINFGEVNIDILNKLKNLSPDMFAKVLEEIDLKHKSILVIKPIEKKKESK